MSTEKIILDNIKYRRSVFPVSYIDQDIPDEIIKELLTYANYAPSHKLTQPWFFTVFKGQGLQALADKMAELYRVQTKEEQFLIKKFDNIKEKILKSAAVIAINIAYSGIVPRWEEIAAVGCATQNLWLAAKAKGIGGYWSTPGTLSGMSDFLQLSQNEECLGLFYLGYHHEKEAEGQRKPVEEKIRWIKS
ncbi:MULTISPECIES: nitroreductase family protein [Olivibacter]|jgi:nitroreductase|uniref:Nitroreductase n=2 Tax=Olivibacter TaxID=376469 RepID=A0ABV6HEZ6_9SPHI|nr:MULTISPECIES: nitroreductase [Olivibacter]MCL4641755.1 nitroreductase [Olivibacter sp. UJ_SKK_5.1]MDM8177504.1 nitroreductase [Olivibacter sp. 47]MDX3912222.1 nitroreductase [Pseudosphingobacterium sp.]QEK99953.1 nitroreductase [Olivibacter sp. LS-1]